MDILRLNIEKTEPDALSESEIRFQVALLAALASVSVSLILRFALDAPLVPELLAQYIFAVVPIWFVELAVGLLGPFAKHLAFLACVVLYLIALSSAALALFRYFARKEGAITRSPIIAIFSFAIWTVTMSILIPLLGGGLFGRYLPQGALYSTASILLAHVIYGLGLALIPRWYQQRPDLERASNTWLNRRRVVRAIGFAVLAVGVYDIANSLLGSWLLKGTGRVKGGSGVFPDIDGLALEVTPVPDFYEVSKNPFDPQVDTARWRLEITGMVERPLSLSYDDIKNLPSIEQYATLACIDNPVGGDLIGNALWRGVRMKDLLEHAGLKAGVVDIKMRASDDYTDSIPLDRAMAEGTMLVYEMNGQPLTRSHGFPLRLIVPGIYGMKNVKWITQIEAVNHDFRGYWQARGWDDRAEYKTMSRIDTPDDDISGATTIAGIAFAGDRGISKVEVSTDGGRSWEEAEIKPALSPFSWALWQKRWTPSRAGKHTLLVRATDGRGITQTAEYAPAAPSGTSGYDRAIVESE
ncbi:MAG: molybdopterin-dependent oxidoreductase [Blastocatellia bacterium]|nr:molybdopterin-dependent oxidoreductase [Blastocatellia bacterium]